MSDEASVASNAAPETAAPVTAIPASEPAATPAVETVADKPASSAREALERAFKKVDEPAKPVETKPAETKPLADHPTDPLRYADGTFKPTKPVEAKPAEKPIEEVKPEAKPIEPTKTGNPPERFTKAAKDAWGNTPDVVRAETERAIAELTSGIEKYKPDAEAFAEIRQFSDLAKQQGTSLGPVLQSYWGLEQLITQNPPAAIVQICNNRNLDPVKVAAAIVGLNPQQIAQMQQMQAPRPAPQPQQANQLPPEWQQRLDQMEDRFAQMTIETFRSSHPYFDDIKTDIADLLKTGYAKSLDDAYAKAVRLNPDVAAKIEAEKAPKPATQSDPAQTRQKAALSVTGSPNSGSNPAARKPAGSAREALQGAFAHYGLA